MCGICAYHWLWMLAGREVIVIKPETLCVRIELVGWGRTQEFDMAHVRDLRVATLWFNPWRASWEHRFIGNPVALTFDYGAKTFYLAKSLEEGEARLLLASIEHLFPASVRPQQE
jgi:hypothetical protein